MYILLYLGDDTIPEHERFKAFIERSQKLCRAWEVTLLLMNNLPSSKKNKTDAIDNFNERVKLGMKTIFNESVYKGYVIATNISKTNPIIEVSKFCF